MVTVAFAVLQPGSFLTPGRNPNRPCSSTFDMMIPARSEHSTSMSVPYMRDLMRRQLPEGEEPVSRRSFGGHLVQRASALSAASERKALTGGAALRKRTARSASLSRRKSDSCWPPSDGGPRLSPSLSRRPAGSPDGDASAPRTSRQGLADQALLSRLHPGSQI